MGNKNERIKAQVSLEFSAAFIVLLILLIATTKLFVWFGNNIVNRHKAYEDTRSVSDPCYLHGPPPLDFYNQSEHQLKIFE